MMEFEDERSAHLHEFLRTHPEGSTNLAACRDLGWHLDTFDEVLEKLRFALQETEWNVACNPPRRDSGRYEIGDGSDRYRFTYWLKQQSEETDWWQQNRLADARGRLKTQRSFAKSMGKHCDPTSVRGIAVRQYEATINHALALLDTIAG